jgi:cytidine deaminase
MANTSYQFGYDVYPSIDHLEAADASLLRLAIQVSAHAYAPYSHFHVGAAARLLNGELVTGTNQENAAYPVGICAERVLLSTASSLYPGVGIQTLAISYQSKEVRSDHPISPCGICRQTLLEFEMRTQQPIRLLLAGTAGEVYVIPKASVLLPLSFTGNDLK